MNNGLSTVRIGAMQLMQAIALLLGFLLLMGLHQHVLKY